MIYTNIFTYIFGIFVRHHSCEFVQIHRLIKIGYNITQSKRSTMNRLSLYLLSLRLYPPMDTSCVFYHYVQARQTSDTLSKRVYNVNTYDSAYICV